MIKILKCPRCCQQDFENSRSCLQDFENSRSWRKDCKIQDPAGKIFKLKILSAGFWKFKIRFRQDVLKNSRSCLQDLENSTSCNSQALTHHWKPAPLLTYCLVSPRYSSKKREQKSWIYKLKLNICVFGLQFPPLLFLSSSFSLLFCPVQAIFDFFPLRLLFSLVLLSPLLPSWSKSRIFFFASSSISVSSLLFALSLLIYSRFFCLLSSIFSAHSIVVVVLLSGMYLQPLVCLVAGRCFITGIQLFLPLIDFVFSVHNDGCSVPLSACWE